MMDAKEIFGIAAMSRNQETAARNHCFGDCGKISLGGAIVDERIGALFVCCETSCPHEEKVVSNYGETMSFGERHIVHIRILKDEKLTPLKNQLNLL